MTTENEHCGLFGKIPQQADFITHHLPDTLTDYWHRWLQSSLSISQEQLGDDWLENFMISPIWHFAIMPGIAHEEAVLGVIIPSVDQVGRYFPLTVAHTGQHDCWAAYLNGDQWYQEAERVALLTLAEATTYTDLVGELETLAVPEIEPLPKYQSQSSVHAYKGNQITQLQEQQTKTDLALSLLPKAYQQRIGNHSLWWTKGSETIDSCLAISSNLPDPGQFAAMLDGQWQKWGWLEEMIMADDEAQATE